MKYFLNTVYCLLFITATAQAGDKIKTILIKTRINCDHCLQCNSCGSRLEKALYDVKGIKRVDVDDKKMLIKVAYHSDKVSPEIIRTTITESGYDADDKKAPDEAVARLDTCCLEQE